MCTESGVLNDGSASLDVALALATRLASLDLRSATASNPKDKEMIDARVRSMPGGFESVNQFVKSQVRGALLASRMNFESDFSKVMACFDRGVTQPQPTPLQKWVPLVKAEGDDSSDTCSSNSDDDDLW